MQEIAKRPYYQKNIQRRKQTNANLKLDGLQLGLRKNKQA